jgi:hypothetical protein
MRFTFRWTSAAMLPQASEMIASAAIAAVQSAANHGHGIVVSARVMRHHRIPVIQGPDTTRPRRNAARPARLECLRKGVRCQRHGW